VGEAEAWSQVQVSSKSEHEVVSGKMVFSCDTFGFDGAISVIKLRL
jgi:hypothetical protein